MPSHQSAVESLRGGSDFHVNRSLLAGVYTSLPPSFRPMLFPRHCVFLALTFPLPAVASPNTQSHCCCLATLAFTSQPLFTSALPPPSLFSLSVWLDEWSRWTVSSTSSAGRGEPSLPVSHLSPLSGPFFFLLLSSFASAARRVADSASESVQI